jgi:hypothetical protein
MIDLFWLVCVKVTVTLQKVAFSYSYDDMNPRLRASPADCNVLNVVGHNRGMHIEYVGAKDRE